MSPPPGPLMPGSGLSGPGISPQQELVSLVSASSKVMINRPCCWVNAGEFVICGTHWRRNGVGLREAAGLTVRARRVVAVIA